jgi:hypothetical protein
MGEALDVFEPGPAVLKPGGYPGGLRVEVCDDLVMRVDCAGKEEIGHIPGTMEGLAVGSGDVHFNGSEGVTVILEVDGPDASGSDSRGNVGR